MPRDVLKWLEILLPIFVLGGVGGAGLEAQSAGRSADNVEYTDQVSIDFLEMELKHNTQISALKERIAHLEGTHGR